MHAQKLRATSMQFLCFVSEKHLTYIKIWYTINTMKGVIFVSDNKKILRSRTFTGVIYPDSISYNFADILANGIEYFDEFGYIRHDKDYDENGEIKKTHYHWVGKKKNATNLDYVAAVLGLKNNEVEIIKNWKRTVQYLVHFNQPDKTSYDISEIEGTLEDVNLYFKEITEGQAVIKMIQERENGLTYKQILLNAVERGYYSEFRRNIAIVDMVVRDYSIKNS